MLSMTIRDQVLKAMKNLQPKEAYEWLQAHTDVLFVDVRMEIESLYVGRPPSVVNVPWYEYPDLQPDAVRFAETVAREATAKTSRCCCCAGLASARWLLVRRWKLLVLPMCSMLCMVLRVSWTSSSSARPCLAGGLRVCRGSKCRLKSGFLTVLVKNSQKQPFLPIKSAFRSIDICASSSCFNSK